MPVLRALLFDLDFCVRDIGTRASTVLDLLEDHVTGLNLGPFTFAIEHRRSKRHLVVRSDELASPESLSSKLDVSPPWLELANIPSTPSGSYVQGLQDRTTRGRCLAGRPTGGGWQICRRSMADPQARDGKSTGKDAYALFRGDRLRL